MKRFRLYSIVIIAVFACAGMAVLISHHHWDSRVIDNDSGIVYCHYVKNPLLRNAHIPFIPPFFAVIVALALFMCAERDIAYSSCVAFVPSYAEPCLAGVLQRGPPPAL